MMRFLAVTRTRARWCLLLLLTEFILSGGQPETNTPAATVFPGLEVPQRLSLTDAQRIAFQRNWDLLAAKSGVDLATAQLIVSKEFPNPNLSWTTLKIDPHGNATSLGNSIWDRSYDTIFSVGQLVEIGGKRHARQNSARA
jgi:cobalt-zinc-cadmium efflux system outer membrane protein